MSAVTQLAGEAEIQILWLPSTVLFPLIYLGVTQYHKTKNIGAQKVPQRLSGPNPSFYK